MRNARCSKKEKLKRGAETAKRYRANNKEIIRERYLKKYRDNIERFKARGKKYRTENAEKIYERNKRYCGENKEKVKIMAANNYRRRGEFLLQFRAGGCELCGRKDRLHFHHVGIRKFKIGGKVHCVSKTISEIQKCVVLCETCHLRFHRGKISSSEVVAAYFHYQALIRPLIETNQ